MKYEDLSPSQKALLAVHYADHKGDEVYKVSQEDYEKRMEICMGCDQRVEMLTPKNELEFYDNKPKINACQQCGCILETKCTDMFQSCPMDQWDKNLNDWDSIVYPNMLKYFEENGINSNEWE